MALMAGLCLAATDARAFTKKEKVIRPTIGVIQATPVAIQGTVVGNPPSSTPTVRPIMSKLGYFHVCQAGYHLPNGGGLSGYLATSRPVMCVR